MCPALAFHPDRVARAVMHWTGLSRPPAAGGRRTGRARRLAADLLDQPADAGERCGWPVPETAASTSTARSRARRARAGLVTYAGAVERPRRVAGRRGRSRRAGVRRRRVAGRQADSWRWGSPTAFGRKPAGLRRPVGARSAAAAGGRRRRSAALPLPLMLLLAGRGGALDARRPANPADARPPCATGAAALGAREGGVRLRVLPSSSSRWASLLVATLTATVLARTPASPAASASASAGGPAGGRGRAWSASAARATPTRQRAGCWCSAAPRSRAAVAGSRGMSPGGASGAARPVLQRAAGRRAGAITAGYA